MRLFGCYGAAIVKPKSWTFSSIALARERIAFPIHSYLILAKSYTGIKQDNNTMAVGLVTNLFLVLVLHACSSCCEERLSLLVC
jgi:hypothetical protein